MTTMSTTTNYITFKLWSFCKMTSDDGVETTWEVRGVYNGPRAGGQAASITHEAIPDLMDAMRMDLLLADPSVTADLAPGTPIQFTLAEVDGRLVVQDATPLPDTTRLALPSRPDSTDA